METRIPLKYWINSKMINLTCNYYERFKIPDEKINKEYLKVY